MVMGLGQDTNDCIGVILNKNETVAGISSVSWVRMYHRWCKPKVGSWAYTTPKKLLIPHELM